MIDAAFIINGLTLAGVLWIATSISGLRERVSRIEGVLKIDRRKECSDA